MSNPTREEVERWMRTGDGPCGKEFWTRDLGEAYLRALDMRDEFEWLVNEHIGKEGFVGAGLNEALKRFDGDETTHDPNAEWGEGRTR